jgi:hypothetical protein
MQASWIRLTLSAGLVSWALCLIGLLLPVAGCAGDQTVDVSVAGLQFRFEKKHVSLVSKSAQGGSVGAVYLDPPVSALPIIPPALGRDSVMVKLDVNYETFEGRRTRALASYGTIILQSGQEAGMKVYSAPPDKLTFWSADILIPKDVSAEIYFICARPYRNRRGEQKEVFCEAETTFGPASRRPRLLLTYKVARSQLHAWRAADEKVREFLSHRLINR